MKINNQHIMQNKKQNIFFILLFTLLTNSIYSQSVSGIITDSKTGELLAGANVFIKDANLGSASNTEGTFSLDLSDLEQGNYTLLVSFIGYHNYLEVINLKNNSNLQLNISLKESLLNLDQIVVTGTRTERLLKDTPVTTQVIGKEQVMNVGGVDASDALAEVTGVVVQTNSFNNGVNSVELQGLNSEHILVMVDGMKMIGRVNGELDISQIPTSEIERIEIVRGAASALYGSEAMGGVINIITQKPFSSFALTANTTLGSYGRVDGNISTTVPVKNWTPSVSLNYRKYNGYDMNGKTLQEDAPAYKKYQGKFNIKGNINENVSLYMETIYITENNEVVSSNIFKDKIDNSNFAMRVGGKLIKLFSNLNIIGNLEYSSYSHNFDRIVQSSGFLKKGSLTKEYLRKANLLFDFKLEQHQINGGYGIEAEMLESDRIEEEKKQNLLNNFFIQDELAISNWLTIVGGLRFDVHSEYGSEISPKLSMMLKGNKTTRIRLSYGHGFRAPSFKELYLDYTNISVGYHIAGNPYLNPEISNALQLDFEFWNDNNYHSRINLFYNNINNLIDYKYKGIIDGFGTYESTNLNSAKTWGGEIDIRYFPTNWFEFSLGYSYLDTWNATTESSMSLKPMHRINTTLKFDLPLDISWNIRGQYIGKKFYWTSFDEVAKTGTKSWISNFFLFHTNLNIPLTFGLTANLGVKNITDYVNKTWGPMPGREWYAGVRYDFDNY